MAHTLEHTRNDDWGFGLAIGERRKTNWNLVFGDSWHNIVLGPFFLVCWTTLLAVIPLLACFDHDFDSFGLAFFSNWLILLLAYIFHQICGGGALRFFLLKPPLFYRCLKRLRFKLLSLPDIRFVTLSMLTNFFYVARRNSPPPSLPATLLLFF